MIWPYLLLVPCLAVEPIYSPESNHPWNELHRVFYSHRFTNGEVYEHGAALDPPWSNWAPFYNDEEFHAHVVAVLDKFLAQGEVELERQPPVRRAILLRDLWSVFDAQTKQHLARTDATRQRQSALRLRLAQAMRRLELSEEELERLPDNLHVACQQRLFPEEFDPASPESPFLPPDLLDAHGPWAPFSWGKDVIGAQSHVEHGEFRSVFVPLIRVSKNRQDTLDFLDRSAKARQAIAPPDSTILALLRRTVLPLSSGKMATTAITESLQVIVVQQSGDRRFKFVLSRADLLNGGSGLRAVTKDEPVDAYGFESGGLHPHRPNYDDDGEELLFGLYAGSANRGIPSLNHCVACHGPTVGSRLFANSGHIGQVGRARESTFELQERLILARKENSFSWGMYQALRN
jgi:hypothetical protein